MAAADRTGGGRSRIVGLATGACLAMALWFLLQELGVPEMTGLPFWESLPFAVATGALLGAVGLAGVVWAPLGLCILLLGVVMWTPLVDGMLPRFIREDRLPEQAPDAVLVLSGNVTADGFIGLVGFSRLVSGIEFAREHHVKNLVVSTVRTRFGRDTARSDRDARDLARRLAPEVELHVLGLVTSTRAEALAVAPLVQREGWKVVAVVTSPLHSRRACESLEKVGVTVLCRPAPERDYSIHHIATASSRLAAFRDWLYETIGLRVYRWRGWVR